MMMIKKSSSRRRCSTAKSAPPPPPQPQSDSDSVHLVLGKYTNLKTLVHEYKHLASLTMKELFIEPSCSYDYGTGPTVAEPNWESQYRQARRLFQALGEFPMLEKIHLQGLGGSPGSAGFPLELLTYLLIHPMRQVYLKELVIENCRFSSNAESMQDLTRALPFLSNLKRLQWDERAMPFSLGSGSSMWGNDHDYELSQSQSRPCQSPVSHSPVLQAILGLPHLEDLLLAASHSSSSFRVSTALERFVKAPHCRTLSLHNMAFDATSLSALAAGLASPTCRLETLNMDVSHSCACDINDLFVQGLPHNTSLTKLELGVSDRAAFESNQCARVLSNALAHNHHLTTLRLRSLRPFSKATTYALAQLLETNDTLTSVQMDANDNLRNNNNNDLAPAMDFYAGLNAKGRHETLQNMSKWTMDEWMTVLANGTSNTRSRSNNHLQNMEALYFWLRRNPSLVASAVAGTKQEGPTNEVEC